MKVLYIESRSKNKKFDLPKDEITKLPNKIYLVYSIQYKDFAKSIKKQLEANNIIITKFQQILGCSIISSKDPVLLIGTGRFHALNLYLQAPAVFLFENNQIIKVPYHDIETLRMRQKTALIKFLSAENIGILVSTKPGQENLKLAEELKQKLEKKGKQVFIFLANNINPAQFENFNIDSWVNTACQGLSLDDPNIINNLEIPKF